MPEINKKAIENMAALSDQIGPLMPKSMTGTELSLFIAWLCDSYSVPINALPLVFADVVTLLIDFEDIEPPKTH